MRDVATVLNQVLSDALKTWIEEEESRDQVASLVAEIEMLKERVRALEDDLLNAEVTREGEEQESREQIEELVAEIEMLRGAVGEKPMNAYLVFRGRDVAHVCGTGSAAKQRADAITKQGKFVVSIMTVPLEWLS